MDRVVGRDNSRYGGKIWIDAQGSCSYECAFCSIMFQSAGMFEFHISKDHRRQPRGNEWKPSQPIQNILKVEKRRESIDKGLFNFRTNTIVSSRSEPTGLKSEKMSKLTCTKCTMTFYNLEQLRSHAREKHIHECVYCPRDGIKSFETLKGLWSHQRDQHESKFTNKCNICPRAFKRHNQLTEHIQNKHARGHDVKCDFCSKILKSVFEKKNHIKKVHSDRRYYCQLCTEYRTTNDDNLRRHTREKHPGQKQPHA